MTTSATTPGGFPVAHHAPGSPLPAITVDDSACAPNDLAQCGGVEITSAADVRWNDLVDRAVASAWPGFELLHGAAATVADAVRDNVARYGQAVADVVASVRAVDRTDGARRSFAFAECGFVPGGSRLAERLPDGGFRYEILDVAFLLRQGDLTAPIRDDDLARALGVEPGTRVPLADAARLVP
jgi:UDP-N-acetylmuramate dehydrogenase